MKWNNLTASRSQMRLTQQRNNVLSWQVRFWFNYLKGVCHWFYTWCLVLTVIKCLMWLWKSFLKPEKITMMMQWRIECFWNYCEPTLGTESQDILASAVSISTTIFFNWSLLPQLVEVQNKKSWISPLTRGTTNVGSAQHVCRIQKLAVMLTKWSMCLAWSLVCAAVGNEMSGLTTKTVFRCVYCWEWDWMSVFANWGAISGTKSVVKRSSATHYTPGDSIMSAWWGKACFVVQYVCVLALWGESTEWGENVQRSGTLRHLFSDHRLCLLCILMNFKSACYDASEWQGISHLSLLSVQQLQQSHSHMTAWWRCHD